ncbi:MAG: hypothetical protein Q7U28_07675 [Aquabacterium sp.]|nr:hypothetical protein [Aquabacterium sp.]
MARTWFARKDCKSHMAELNSDLIFRKPVAGVVGWVCSSISQSQHQNPDTHDFHKGRVRAKSDGGVTSARRKPILEGNASLAATMSAGGMPHLTDVSAGRCLPAVSVLTDSPLEKKNDAMSPSQAIRIALRFVLVYRQIW